MAQQRIDKSSEAFKILQENLSSARDKDLSTEDVEKAIRGNKNLLKIYKEIEASLKKSTELYKQNRKSLEYINELNRETFKNLKADTVTRKQLNDINRQNIKYLDTAQELTRESLRNDIDSVKIKEKIAQLNNAISRSEREKREESEKYNETFKDLTQFIERNSNKFSVGNGATNYITEIQKLENSYRDAIDKMNTSSTQKTISKYQNLAEQIKSEQNKYISQLFNTVDYKTASGKISKQVGESIKTELSVFLGEAFQSSNIMSSLNISSNIASKTAKQLENEKKRVEANEKKIGTIGKIFEGLGQTPLNSLIDFKGAKERMKDAGAVGNSVTGSALKSLAGSSFIGQMGAIGGSYYVLKEIVKLMALADTRVTNLAKSFGLSKSETGDIYKNIAKTVMDSGQLGLNIGDLVQAQIAFNDQFGYSVELSGDMLKNIAQSTKLIGLSTESTNELIKQSLTTNQDINKVEADILGQLSYQSKGLLGNKNMLEKVLHISGEVRANFKGNVENITKAIVKAKEYGTSLEKVNQIGEGLLDWESSISAELEAELITGRQINLEKARYASLMGDTATLMEEINKNVGDFDQFTNMNVIQQQSFAKALGMTREEMTNMLFEQQVNAKIISLGNKKFTEDQRTFLSQSDSFKKSYNKIMNDGALTEKEKMEELGKIAQSNLSQLSAQQKFEEALIKVKEKIAQIFGDGAVLDKFADGLISVMNKGGLIGEAEHKKHLAENIVSRTNPNLPTNSDTYKSLVNKMVSGFDISVLKNKNDIVSLQTIEDKNTPSYNIKKNRIIDKNTPIMSTEDYQRQLLQKFDEFMSAFKDSNGRPININGVRVTESLNIGGAVNTGG